MIPTIAQLDALVAAVPPKSPIMPGGVRRWIPAATPRGAQIEAVSEQFLADVASRVNTEAVSIPIDGGLDGNVAHESASRDAVGWAHRAAVFEGKLYLDTEVTPELGARIDAGRVAYSSIDADYQVTESGDYVSGSARLVTHAITNTPRDRQQEPMQAIRASLTRRVTFTERARLAQETSMTKKSETETAKADTKAADVKSEETKQAEAPKTLEEALAKIAELESKLSSMEAVNAEMSTQLSESVQASARLQEESATQKLETECAAVVDEAIRVGQIAPASRERFMKLARASLETVKASIASIPKRAQRVTQTAEAKQAETKSTADADLTEREKALATQLRAGGVSEKRIKSTIEAQCARKVV